MSKVVLRRVWSQKASHADAIDFARRIVWRHADNDGPLPFARELVPDGKRLDGSRISETELVVGMIHAIAKPIDSERTRVLAGAHAHPCRNSNWRIHAFEASVKTGFHQPTQVYQTLVSKDDFGCGAVES